MARVIGGGETIFKFSSDLNTFSVKTSQGEEYVYKRSTASASINTCSLIKGKSEYNGLNNTTISSMYTMQSYYPAMGNNSTDNSYSERKNNKGREMREQPVRHTCSRCNGNRRIVHESTPYGFGSSTDHLKKYCNECGKSFPSSWGHSHIDCPQCHGKGYFTTN